MRLIKMHLLFIWLLFFAGQTNAAPEIKNWETENGAQVYFVEAHELPIVDIRIVFNAGSARDGGTEGIASMANHMMMFGADQYDANEIADQFDGLGAEVDNGALKDMAWFSLRSLGEAEKLDPAVDLLASIITSPSYAEDDFQRERERALIGLQYEQQSPKEIAAKAFLKALYQDHPYASHTSGTEGSLKKLTPGMLRKFHDQYYVAKNAVIAIVGDLGMENAQVLAKRLVHGLREGMPAPPLPTVKGSGKAKRTEIQFPSAQSHVYIGQPGMTRNDPDYMALYVGNHVLGGSGLVSRLSEKVREERGLSYSVYSYFSPMSVKGPFQIGLQTRNDQAEEAIEVVRNTVNEFIVNGPTEEELNRSKKNITGGFPLRLDSNKKIAEYVAMIGFYDLPLDYLDTFVSRVEAVDRKAIMDAFSRRVQPEQFSTVIVGEVAQ